MDALMRGENAMEARVEGRRQQMKVKVLFTLQGPSYPLAASISSPLIRIARLSESIYVTPRMVSTSDGTELILGDVTAKACLYGVAVSQPELLMDASRDYSLSMLDVVESNARRRARKLARPFCRSASSSGSSPADDLLDMTADSPSPSQLLMPESPEKPKGEVFEGKGMMRWVMQERGEGKTMLTGRVRKRTPGDLVDTLELTLKLHERPAMNRGDFVENMRSLANPPATPGNPSPHLNSPSAEGFLGRLLRNEIGSSRALGSPPQLVTARAPAPASLQTATPVLPPEVAALIREAMAPNGQPRTDAAPELVQLANGILKCYGAQGTTTPLMPKEANVVVPKKRAALTTQPLPPRPQRQNSNERPQDAIALAHSAGSSLAIRPSALPPNSKRPRIEAPAPPAPLQRQQSNRGRTQAAHRAAAAAQPSKTCSSCGTTNSKRWSVQRHKPDVSHEERESTRMCETCYRTQRPIHEGTSRKGSLARSTSSTSVTQSSPPRSVGKRRVSLPLAAQTSPVRGSRHMDGTTSEDEELPPVPGVTAIRSRLFESEIIPPSSSPVASDSRDLHDFVLNASPGTALNRIMFSDGPEEAPTPRRARGTDELSESKLDMATFLFPDMTLAAPIAPVLSEQDYHFTMSLSSTTASKTFGGGGMESSSSGLTEAAGGLDLLSSPQNLGGGLDIFGSPSKWALLSSPTRPDDILHMLKTSKNVSPEGFSYETLFGSMVRHSP